MSVTKELMDPIDSHRVHQLFDYSCLLMCSAEERNSYRFGTTFGWTISL